MSETECQPCASDFISTASPPPSWNTLKRPSLFHETVPNTFPSSDVKSEEGMDDAHVNTTHLSKKHRVEAEDSLPGYPLSQLVSQDNVDSHHMSSSPSTLSRTSSNNFSPATPVLPTTNQNVTTFPQHHPSLLTHPMSVHPHSSVNLKHVEPVNPLAGVTEIPPIFGNSSHTQPINAMPTHYSTDPSHADASSPDGLISTDIFITRWEDESTHVYQMETGNTILTRRVDNNMVNGTKLLNLAGLSRGKRDGLLKNERPRVVVKNGAMHLKGVWIALNRARILADQFGIRQAAAKILCDDPTVYKATEASISAYQQQRAQQNALRIASVHSSVFHEPPPNLSNYANESMYPPNYVGAAAGQGYASARLSTVSNRQQPLSHSHSSSSINRSCVNSFSSTSSRTNLTQEQHHGAFSYNEPAVGGLVGSWGGAYLEHPDSLKMNRQLLPPLTYHVASHHLPSYSMNSLANGKTAYYAPEVTRGLEQLDQVQMQFGMAGSYMM